MSFSQPPRPFLRFVALLCGLWLVGCTPVKPHWYVENTGTVIKPHEKNDDFDEDLRVVEFDELGDLWSVEQQKEAIRHIEDKSDPFVIVYVHGWRHSAEPFDGDLQSFNKFVKGYKKIRSDKKVVAIYISWRGGLLHESAFTYIPNVLGTVWDRKEATDRLAGIPMNDTFWKIRNATKGKVFLVGHSFGGRIIEKCVGTSLVGSNYNKDANNRKNLPADLIMLINPASEGIYARQMKRALQGWKDDTPPGIISVRADTDSATGWAWRWAMRLESSRKAFYGGRTYPPEPGFRDRNEKQSGYLSSTAGSDSRLIDWKVGKINQTRELPPKSVPAIIQNNLDQSGIRNWFWVGVGGESDSAESYALQPNIQDPDAPNTSKSANGYWVLSVPSEILYEHGGIAKTGGIFNPQMQSLVAGLFGLTHGKVYKAPPKKPPPPEPDPKRMEQENPLQSEGNVRGPDVVGAVTPPAPSVDKKNENELASPEVPGPPIKSLKKSLRRS